MPFQEAAQRVLEDGLLAEDSATGEGRRTSVDSLTLISQFKYIGLDAALLEKLEKTYLIRRELNTGGGFSFVLYLTTLSKSSSSKFAVFIHQITSGH